MTPDHIRAQIIALRTQDMTTDDVANQLDISRNIVCKTWWLYHTGQRYQHLKPSANGSKAAHARVRVLPKPEAVTRLENTDTDIGAWRDAKRSIFSGQRYVRVMHMNDVHLPYHDTAALSMFYRIAERFQPHIIIVGSDAFDFPTISRFDPDTDIDVDDWLYQLPPLWVPLIDALQEAAPDAILPFIFGNHDQRGLQAAKGSSLPRVATAKYIETIRANGRVMYLGNTEVLHLGALVVAHGHKANKYAANSLAQTWPTKYVNAGHTHRPQVISSSTVNGCLCQLIPHYHDKGYPTNWQQGTSTITIDTHTDTVNIAPHLFHVTSDQLWTVYAGEILSEQLEFLQEQAA